MLLAAGFGSRMVPVTLNQAKPTMPFLNRALLLRQLDYLNAAGCSDVVVNVHHEPESICDLLTGEAEGMCSAGGDSGVRHRGEPWAILDMKVHLSPEPERLGTSGGVKGAAHLLRGQGTLVCLNADMITGIELGAALAAHRRLGRPATLVLVPWSAACGYTPVHHDGHHLVCFGHPGDTAAASSGRMADAAGQMWDTAPGIFTGIHFLEESILDQLPPGRSEFVPDLYQPMLDAGEPPAVIMAAGPWYELGTPDRYLSGQQCALQQTPPAGHRAWGGPIASDCVLGAGLRLENHAILGRAVTVQPDVRVSASVIMEQTVIGAGSDLEQVIVGPGVQVPAGSSLRRTVLAQEPAAPPELPARVRRWEGLLRADF